jgi:hypothetical protein
VIGRTNIPLVLEGEALFHVARFEDAREVAQHLENFHTEQTEAPFPVDNPPIV